MLKNICLPEGKCPPSESESAVNGATASWHMFLSHEYYSQQRRAATPCRNAATLAPKGLNFFVSFWSWSKQNMGRSSAILRRYSQYLSADLTKLVVGILEISQFDYCQTIWANPKRKDLDKLQLMQNN